MLNRKFIPILGLILTLTISSNVLFAVEANKRKTPAITPTKPPQGMESRDVVEKRNAELIAEMERKKAASSSIKAEMIQNNKENTQLLLEHTEKMRTLNINNINEMYNRIINSHKELQKITDDVINGNGKPLTNEQYKAREEQLKKAQEAAQADYLALAKSEEEKFQSMMKKRQEDALKKK